MTNQEKKELFCSYCVLVLFMYGGYHIMTITIPKIQDAFNVGLNQVPWAINLYTIIFFP